MKKYLPYLALAAVAYFLWKKKAAPAGAKPSAAGASSSVVGQLAALFNANAAKGKGSASAINVKNVGGGSSGSGTSLSGAGINLNGLIKGIGSTLGRFFSGGPDEKTSFDQFVSENAPITHATDRAANAAVDSANADINFGGSPLGSAYDYKDFNFDGSNEFGDNFDNLEFAA